MAAHAWSTKRVWTLAAMALLPCVAHAQVVLPGGVSAGQVNPSLQREQIDAQQRQQQIEERARRIEIPALQGAQPENAAGRPGRGELAGEDDWWKEELPGGHLGPPSPWSHLE